MSGFRLNRRAVLRGAAGITIALPFLEIMSPRSAGAGGAAPPKRLIVMYSSNGTVLKDWKPTTRGTDFEVSPILAPLDTPLLRPKLSVLSGIQMGSAKIVSGNGHAIGMTNMLVARPFSEVEPTEFGDVGWGGGVSFDRFVAKRLAAAGQRESIHAGIGTKKSYQNFYAYMSYDEGGGAAAAVGAVDDPATVFTQLFANVPDSDEARAALERVVTQRKRAIDLAKGDFDRLLPKLGAADKQRLDRHLEELSQLQDRIAVSGSFCQKPAVPGIPPEELFDDVRIPDVAQAQIDNLVAAIACDLTRVGTLQFGSGQDGATYTDFVDAEWDQLIGDRYHHGLSHSSVGSTEVADDNQARAQRCLAAINRWMATQLAALATGLAGVEEADGTTALDHTAILWCSEISEGPTHSFDDIPFVLVGDLGGALRTGQHVDYGNARNHNDLFVTLAQGLGLADVTTFGQEDLVEGPLAELLA